MNLSVKDRMLMEGVRDFITDKDTNSDFRLGDDPVEPVASHLPRLESEGKIWYDGQQKRYMVAGHFLPLLRTF